MKCECIISKMRDIILNADRFYTKKINENRMPIIKNHIPMFLILSNSNEPKLFNEVYKELGISKSSLSDIVNKYHKIGLVNKYTPVEDKRSILVSLTDEGVKIKEMLNSFEKEFLECIYEGLDLQEKEVFERYLDHALKNSVST